MKLILTLAAGVLTLAACTPSVEQCQTAQTALGVSSQLATTVDFTTEHQAMANEAVAAGSALVGALCPAPVAAAAAITP